MPNNKKPVEVIEEVTVQVPMTGAAMKERLESLKKDKELKEGGKRP
jgi:hypothetical protein